MKMPLFFKPTPIVAAACFLIVGAAPLVQAGSLQWDLTPSIPPTPLVKHLLSDGSPIPAGTVFQLGVFVDSFVPTAVNQAQWASNWRAADFGDYDPAFTTVSGDYKVETNVSPFTVGKQMYVWGVFQKADGSSEQWLGADESPGTSWKVPSDNPLDSPVNIVIDAATTMLLGSADSVADTIQMEAVPAGADLPLIYGDYWRNHYFTAAEMGDPQIGAWDADPDADGISNELEFAMGTNPRDAQSRGSMSIAPDVAGLLLSFPGSVYAAVIVGMEESTTLQAPWSALVPAPTLNLTNSRWELHNVPATIPRNFFRTTVQIIATP